ncbi:unnamed protein product [Pseudo-nitzschia multistriata]|uniref:Myb-like domain-containing protein n=1 Tax=Pseudo-nitzschia multistriata TaxID=183589 RepID=A0A448Z680_9STRA|nr:unnamed protein product [Pseudo-nitzschia multistriata]
MEPNAPNGRRTGTVNYSEEELEDLMEVIVEELPIDSEQWNTVVARHAVKYPFDRSKKSIRNKYNAIKKKRSSTGNPNMPRYVMLARRAHYLIGRKANLGTGEEDFDMKKGFIVSEAEEGLERIPSAEVQEGRAPVAPVIQAGDASTVEGEESPTILPVKVQSSTPNKRSYSKVPDATVFNEYLISQQARDKENREIALEQSKIAKEASEIAKETNLMWKNALAMAMSCFQQWQSTQLQPPVLQNTGTNNDNAVLHDRTNNDDNAAASSYQSSADKRPGTSATIGEESHGENN